MIIIIFYNIVILILNNIISVKLKSNEAVVEFDFNFTEMDLTEVAGGEPASTKLKATRLEIEVQRENQGIGHH